MTLDLHYINPRLVDLYDIENPLDEDSDFYMGLANELNAQTIVDFGCGTGLLTRALATGSRAVFGVDPSPTMLAFARRQPSADRVTWVHGYADALGSRDADLLIMTGNVAQVFLEEAEWAAALASIWQTLRPGGKLAFESRNPKAKAWEEWVPEHSYYRFESPHGEVESWLELLEVGDGIIHFQAHNVFSETNEDIVVGSRLRFRSDEEIHASLERAGFSVEQVYGGWHKEPFVQETSKPMIFIAKRVDKFHDLDYLAGIASEEMVVELDNSIAEMRVIDQEMWTNDND